MSSKFNDVPVEKDTIILFSENAHLGVYEVLYQKWFWDGITAESIIFAAKDVAGFDDNELEIMLRESPLVRQDSKITLERSAAGYTFANFNFETE